MQGKEVETGRAHLNQGKFMESTVLLCLKKGGAYEGWEGSEWHKTKNDGQIDSSDEHVTFTALLPRGSFGTNECTQIILPLPY